MSVRLVLPALALLLASASACEPIDPDCSALVDVPQAAWVGGGEASWEDIEDGDEVEVIAGTQGGFHVWGSVRATGVYEGTTDNPGAPENPRVAFRVETRTGRS